MCLTKIVYVLGIVTTSKVLMLPHYETPAAAFSSSPKDNKHDVVVSRVTVSDGIVLATVLVTYEPLFHSPCKK